MQEGREAREVDMLQTAHLTKDKKCCVCKGKSGVRHTMGCGHVLHPGCASGLVACPACSNYVGMGDNLAADLGAADLSRVVSCGMENLKLLRSCWKSVDEPVFSELLACLTWSFQYLCVGEPSAATEAEAVSKMLANEKSGRLFQALQACHRRASLKRQLTGETSDDRAQLVDELARAGDFSDKVAPLLVHAVEGTTLEVAKATVMRWAMTGISFNAGEAGGTVGVSVNLRRV